MHAISSNGKGTCVFVIGGSPRDVINELKTYKDIDIAFGCPANTVVELCEERKWAVSSNPQSGLVKIGTATASASVVPLEGKSIGCMNNDVCIVDEKLGCRSIGCDLAAENIYGDFCTNRLWYEPFVDAIFDATGYGASSHPIEPIFS